MRDYGMAAAEDDAVFDGAAREERVIISADTEFGTLLSLWPEVKPSFILVRRVSQRRPKDQVALLLANLPNIENALQQGSEASSSSMKSGSASARCQSERDPLRRTGEG